MRCLNKNKQTVYYATFSTKTEIKDSNNFVTGEYTMTYSNPVLLKAHVSEASGVSSTAEYGIDKSYSKRMIVDNMSCPIIETSILWVDTMPTIATCGTTTTPHDYIVSLISKSLNTITYGLKKVDMR